ncbi:MAG: SHOCT domain-containing protein [Nitrospiraceae bacterium]
MDRFTDCGWMPMMGIGILGMVMFWALLVAGLIVLGKWLWGHGTMSREDSALDIVKKRYARGEINRQEFENMKRDLIP